MRNTYKILSWSLKGKDHSGSSRHIFLHHHGSRLLLPLAKPSKGHRNWRQSDIASACIEPYWYPAGTTLTGIHQYHHKNVPVYVQWGRFKHSILGKENGTLKDNIKMELDPVIFKAVYWIQGTKNGVQWWEFGKTKLKLGFSRTRILFASWWSTIFSRRILVHGVMHAGWLENKGNLITIRK